MTVKAYRESLLKPGPKKSKFKNIKVDLDGIKFDSKKEAARYVHLKRLEAIGGISMLERQEKYRLEVNGVHVATYVADFVYCNKNDKIIVEDVKSAHTRKLPVYRLKKKLMKAIYNIDIMET